MRLALIVLSAIGLFTISTSAQACRVNPVPQDIIAGEYETGIIHSVAIAEITAITDHQGNNAQFSWQKAEAEILTSTYGPRTTGTIEFAYNVIISRCNWPPLIKAGPGERVAVYFTQNGDGQRIVRLVADLSYAVQFDEKLRSTTIESGEMTSSN